MPTPMDDIAIHFISRLFKYAIADINNMYILTNSVEAILPDQ